MTRPVWHIHLRIELVNGTAGVVELTARDLITIKEVRAQFDKALRMCDTLKAEPVAEVEARQFKVVS